MGRFRGSPRRRTAALYIINDAGQFTHDSKAEVFLHQGEARTAGCRKGFLPSKGSPAQGSHGADFIFHLDIDTAVTGQFLGSSLSDFRTRGNRIARIETSTGSDGAGHHGIIAFHKFLDSFSHLLSLHINSKVRATHGAHLAANAYVSTRGNRRFAYFLIKDLFRTQGRADSALLAELCVDLDEKLSFHGHPSIQIVPLEDS